MNTNIQSSTIKVPKTTLESIKVYCQKRGKNVSSFVEYAYNFITKNNFDIYDNEATPYITVNEEKEKNQVEILCQMMGNFIATQQQI